MNSVYVETASRIYAKLCAAKAVGELQSSQKRLAEVSFDAARIFMDEYRERENEEAATIQQALQQHPGAVMGSDPLEIRKR